MTGRYWIAMCCGLCVVLGGAVCGALLVLGYESVLAFGAEGISMRAATATGFVAIGAAIAVTALTPVLGARSFTFAASLAALSLGVVGAIAIAEIVQGRGMVSSGVPSRGTLIAFTMAGSALWLRIMDIRLCRWLGAPTAILGLVALVGHAVGAPVMYWASSDWVGMAVVTSLLCVPMGVGIWLMPRNGALDRLLLLSVEPAK